ncbi:MAG TPA: hypothetical protein VGF01_22430, partial [Terracidiphilus sp.]
MKLGPVSHTGFVECVGQDVNLLAKDIPIGIASEQGAWRSVVYGTNWNCMPRLGLPRLCASFCRIVTSYSSRPVSLRMVIAQVPEIHIRQSALLTEPPLPEEQPVARPASQEASAVRAYLLARGNSAWADRGFHWLMVLCALSIFGIVVLIATELMVRSKLAWHSFGLDFFYKAYIDAYTGRPLYWDPVNGHFSA